MLQQEGTSSFWGKAGDAGLGKVRCELVEQARVGVMVESVRVDTREVGRESERVDVDLGRPRVERQLGGQVAKEVLAFGHLARDGDVGRVTEVEEPDRAAVVLSDGD